jgi:hypothetical protein
MLQQVCVTTKYNTHEQGGYVVLISTLIITGMLITVAISLLAANTTELQTAAIRSQSLAARYVSDACAEVMLEEVQTSGTENASGQLTLPGGTCTYSMSAPTPESRTILSSAAVEGAVRKVRVELSQVSPTITISSWQEVPDF